MVGSDLPTVAVHRVLERENDMAITPHAADWRLGLQISGSRNEGNPEISTDGRLRGLSGDTHILEDVEGLCAFSKFGMILSSFDNMDMERELVD